MSSYHVLGGAFGDSITNQINVKTTCQVMWLLPGKSSGYFTLFGSRGGGGADATPGFAKGGHFEVKEGHPDFLQIT